MQAADAWVATVIARHARRPPMPYERDYAAVEPVRTEVDALPGWTLLEFGAPWCGHCVHAQGAIRDALAVHPDVRHLKVEDGPGRPLGRSFRIKLWPTLVLLEAGAERGRAVRPRQTAEVARLLGATGGDGPPGNAASGEADTSGAPS